jgi:hypothetical protein
MEVDQSNPLISEAPFVITGYIYSEWLLAKPLPGLTERDQEGYYFISNEGLGLYAVGVTWEEALVNFKASLIDNYQLLEASAKDDSDLQALFREYQTYLKPPSKDH